MYRNSIQQEIENQLAAGEITVAGLEIVLGITGNTGTSSKPATKPQDCAAAFAKDGLFRIEMPKIIKDQIPHLHPNEAILLERLSTGEVNRQEIETIAGATKKRALETTQRLYTPAEADQYLQEKGINLSIAGACERDASDMVRWGILPQRKENEYYSSLLKLAVVTERDLHQLALQQKHKKLTVIPGVDNMTPQEAFERLIIDAKIPYTDHYTHKKPNLSRYEKVDLKTGKLSKIRPSKMPGLLFTPTSTKVFNSATNGDDILEMMKRGYKFMGPVGWMKLFRKSLDDAARTLFREEAANLYKMQEKEYKKLLQKALKDPRVKDFLPDFTTLTRFADLRYSYWSPLDQETYSFNVEMGDFSTDSMINLYETQTSLYSAKRISNRPVLGTFLS